MRKFYFISYFLILLLINFNIYPKENNYDFENKIIWHLNRDYNNLILSFDDAPSKYTSDILEILNQYKIKAYFFIIGTQVKGQEKIIRQIKKGGHIIGNHSFAHKTARYFKKSHSSLRDDIEKTQDIIKKITGRAPEYYRPPQGYINNSLLYILAEKKLKVMMWDVDSRDWEEDSFNNIVNNVINNVKPGSIILMHSNKEKTVMALPIILDYCILSGYKFTTLEDYYNNTKLRNKKIKVLKDKNNGIK